MTYATKQVFGGQRASLGRVIIFKGDAGYDPSPMMIDDINAEHDEPVIEGTCGAYKFYDARTEADIATMPDYSWCWPPRLEQPREGGYQAGKSGVMPVSAESQAAMDEMGRCYGPVKRGNGGYHPQG